MAKINKLKQLLEHSQQSERPNKPHMHMRIKLIQMQIIQSPIITKIKYIYNSFLPFLPL